MNFAQSVILPSRKATGIFELLLIFQVILMIVAGGEAAAAGGRKRASEEHDSRSRQSNTKPKSCFDIMKSCRRHKDCREALVKLKTKCEVRAGSCNANMRNLPVCADIMDLLSGSQFFDPNQKCSCNKERGHCAAIHQKIYKNPCFGSVRYLRSMNLLPRLEEMAPPSNVQSKLTSVTRDASDDVFEAFMTYSDYASEEISQLMTSSPSPSTSHTESTVDVSAVSGDVTKTDDVIIPKTTQERINYVERKTYVDARNPPTNSMPHNDVALLHVVAIATGVLLLVMVTAGAALLFFVSVKRKESLNERKVTMT
uniref:GDNF/GAS1 domain-containing protein n=1 Tax=Ciona savignyi TaxID=51511 RepID=H2ZJH7_CIOSA